MARQSGAERSDRALPRAVGRLVSAVLTGLLAACAAPGTVLDSAMSLDVSNGTTIPVTILVNDQQVSIVDPGQGLHVLGPNLPSLPWAVVAQSPSGRTLLTLAVHSGDVVRRPNFTSGPASRVDLSCGRLDMWSGPPLGGPMPGPGSPGDCD